MNPDVKKLWVEALRSGKYEQGQGHLRDEQDRYCCLGVLADVQGVAWERNGPGWLASTPGGLDANSTSCPSLTAGPAGLDLDDQNVLMEMNDEGDSFEEIADWIEANL